MPPLQAHRRSQPLTLQPGRNLPHDTLVRLFAEVADEALDHHTQLAREALGRIEEARTRLRAALSLPAPAHWFTVGLTPDGAPAGYAVPVLLDGNPVLADIGVARPHRGNGHVHQLLAAATARLELASPLPIRADVDASNHPMRAAFTRAGYRVFATRQDFVWRA